ncbi:exo-beta-N-acetylmuramidase NamZ domain-containing protein [Estrella lausannensis]|uniref:Uncharacterized protein n=1 Tax=Estrella lausannensis TaxID=483423 RepID=A0A0H5E2L7_9BACT|nr:DUF1343 domain-containing protein [Estrella lausannensis]CRX37440.1 Conserved hypothetical protein [Estrella lausannensis]
MRAIYLLILLLAFCVLNEPLAAAVKPGIDVLISTSALSNLKGKKIGLVTNHTAVSRNMEHTFDLLRSREKLVGYKLTALFAPEHGLFGSQHASEDVKSFVSKYGIPVHSLHGKTRRPTDDMLKGIDLIIYDIQDIGSRSYTYTTTLYYVMEEAAKRGIGVMVLDRPNPIGGKIVDGPMLDQNLRSMVGYINVPYCHGMTAGELALFFNKEYAIGCSLQVIPMEGWKRSMTFDETGLQWIPTSPQIPEATTPFFYPMTGILGELSVVNIGVGYTLPFKVVGAPWIDGKKFAKQLNDNHFAGIYFEPFCYKPFFGKFAGQDCQGVMIVIKDKKRVKPVSVQFLLIGTLKALYPDQFKEALSQSKQRRQMFDKVSGSRAIFEMMETKPFIIWPLISFQEKERLAFLEKRKNYLLAEYRD